MPRWDFKCPECGRVEEHFFESYHAMLAAVHDEAEPVCHCQDYAQLIQMERQPASGSFIVFGYNARNGYSGGR